MQFPVEWHNCPPVDAALCAGVYFRVGRSSPPTSADFRSQAALGRASGGDACLRVGLSMLCELADAHHLARLNPRLGSVIYKGSLTADHGKSKLTSSQRSPSHTTWWPFAAVDRASPFAVVEV